MHGYFTLSLVLNAEYRFHAISLNATCYTFSNKWHYCFRDFPYGTDRLCIITQSQKCYWLVSYVDVMQPMKLILSWLVHPSEWIRARGRIKDCQLIITVIHVSQRITVVLWRSSRAMCSNNLSSYGSVNEYVNQLITAIWHTDNRFGPSARICVWFMLVLECKAF